MSAEVVLQLMAHWKIGAVSYLNSKPLVYRLEEHVPRSTIHFDLPSRLASQLHDGDLDVALIPSIEAFQNPEYKIVSDACIACRGPVWSVKLLSRVPFRRIQTLAVDEGSRTSVALVQILLGDQHGVFPALRPLAIDEPWHEAETDAVLIIGDRAMHASSDAFPFEIDLGEWWNDATGNPFVFAMWVARGDVDTTKLGSALSLARDNGLAHIDEIVRAEAPKYGLTNHQCLNYFQNNLHFRLGPAECSGLERFRELVNAMRPPASMIRPKLTTN